VFAGSNAFAVLVELGNATPIAIANGLRMRGGVLDCMGLGAAAAVL
jgi:hypothetical protein